jgi:lipid II isoglutaminyl synthase (glutamine-hydrolysing)
VKEKLSFVSSGVPINFFDRIRLALAVSTAKTVISLINLLRLGAGSVLPGTLAYRIQPKILSLLSSQIAKGTIVIAGTNGKTTTSLLLRQILEQAGYRVAHNAAGANLVNGLITALSANANLWGTIQADYAILEIDENIIPLAVPELQPRLILCLNLFRDQLDRYGEVDTIGYRWEKAIAQLSPETIIILNGDDPTLAYLGNKLGQESGWKNVKYFGLTEPDKYLAEMPHAVDAIYCPSCGHPLSYKGFYLSHLGDFDCSSCGFSKPNLAINSQEWGQILIGVYNKYNTLAAGLAAQELGIDRSIVSDTINNFQAAFGRAEELEFQGKKVRILLSKNPVGMNETIRAVSDIQQVQGASTTLLVLNDRTPDGTDVSWIWDVDMENLVKLQGTIVVSGDRVYDMALRIYYSETDLTKRANLIVKEDLQEAVATALEMTPSDRTLDIVPTYSAMLEVREILTGRKIL